MYNAKIPNKIQTHIKICEDINSVIKPYIPLTLYPRRGNRGILDIPAPFYQNYLAMRNDADVTGGKCIA
jgi:hypothetical protein